MCLGFPPNQVFAQNLINSPKRNQKQHLNNILLHYTLLFISIIKIPDNSFSISQPAIFSISIFELAFSQIVVWHVINGDNQSNNRWDIRKTNQRSNCAHKNDQFYTSFAQGTGRRMLLQCSTRLNLLFTQGCNTMAWLRLQTIARINSINSNLSDYCPEKM